MSSEESPFASSKYTAGQLNAMVTLLIKQGGKDGPDRFLRGEIALAAQPYAWREQDDIIYFPVTSNGKTGEQWITHFGAKGIRLSLRAKKALRSEAFKPTSGVTTEIAVLKGLLIESHLRITSNIRAEAARRRFSDLSAEVACLVRDKVTDTEIKAMGLSYIVAMHAPIDTDGVPYLLSADCGDDGPWLRAHDGWPDDGWHRDGGFAFVVQQAVLGTLVP